MSEIAEAADAAPTGSRKRRRLISVFIAAFLLYHIVTPLRYYVGADETDDRFAWRMFSSSSRMQKVDLERRSVVVTETMVQGDRRVDRTVPVNSLVTKRWSRFFRRGSEDVVAAFLRWRKQQSGAETVHMDVKRSEPDGSMTQVASYELDADDHFVQFEESAP